MRDNGGAGQAPLSQAEYEALALAQVTELWTQFGNLTEIWLDGGCGAMCDKVGALVKKTNVGRESSLC
jgi:L-serine deaminase